MQKLSGDIPANVLALVEMIGTIYEELDIDNVEDKFFNLINEIFAFDRTALFFIKHRKAILQGKLSRGFPASLNHLELKLAIDHPLIEPLVTGLPLPLTSPQPGFRFPADTPPVRNGALIPLVKRQHTPCWQMRDCRNTGCPVHGRKWLRCWLVSGTHCTANQAGSQEEKAAICSRCSVFQSYDSDSIEGLLLVDNSLSGQPIGEQVMMALSIMAHAVAVAINNSKRFKRTLDSAIRDELTRLYNRRYFNERLVDELDRAERYGEELSLISCDIDYFKRINDQYGHPTGDAVLAWFGRMLLANLRKTDIVARYGGEEFMILLLNTSKTQALRLAEKLRSRIQAAVLAENGQQIRLTVSCGVAGLGEDGTSLEGLIARADQALYSAKARGRNLVCAA